MKWPWQRTPEVAAFMRERRDHMNVEMERKGLELPDPDDLVPPDALDLSPEAKLALYAEHWATIAANGMYLNDMARRPPWEQLVLPGMPDPRLTAAPGWCLIEEESCSST